MRRLLVTIAYTLAALAATANAQPASGILNREGPGFRLGHSALTFHPGLSIESGYDSNVFYHPDTPIGSGLLRLRAHFDLKTNPPVENGPGTVPPKVEFRLGTTIEYREYLTTDTRVQAQRAVIFGLAADLVILPHGPFTLMITEQYLRTVDPRNFEVTGQFVRNYNRVGVLGTYRRGGLELGIGDTFAINFWETQQLQFGNSMVNDAQAFARLRFLPQTLGSLLVRVGYVYFPNRPAGNAIPFRVLVGASTLFTTWLGVSAAIGYGASFNTVGPSFSHVIAQAEVRFILPYQARISLGYNRDFHETLYANFFLDDRIFVAYDQPLVKKLTARLEGGVRFRHYEGLVDPTMPLAPVSPTLTRDELLYDLQATLAYRPLVWLQLGLNYTLLGSSSDFVYQRSPTDPNPLKVSFIKHVLLAQIEFAY